MTKTDIVDVLVTSEDISSIDMTSPWIDLSLIGSRNYEVMEREIVRLTNLEREKCGIHPLTYTYLLSQSALLHSLDMAENHFISHTGSDGSTLKQRILRLGNHDWVLLGENLAMGQRTPAQVINAWMSSPGHRENLLNHNFFEIGVAYIEGDVKLPIGSYWRAGYWVQHFGARSSHMRVSAILRDWLNYSRISAPSNLDIEILNEIEVFNDA